MITIFKKAIAIAFIFHGNIVASKRPSFQHGILVKSLYKDVQVKDPMPPANVDVFDSLSKETHLPKPVLVKLYQLHTRGESNKVSKLLGAVSKLEKLYLQHKCRMIFSRHLCSNTSAQPFFLWAKMFANKITRGHSHR